MSRWKEKSDACKTLAKDTDAAIKAKRDSLHGLKENVITGKLIPAGTGMMAPEEEAAILENFSVLDDMRIVKNQYVEKHDRPDSNE